MAAGEILFHEDSTRTYTLNAFMSRVEGIIAEASANNLSLMKALSLVASIEESLIERKVLDHFDSDSPQLRNLMERLKGETEQHASKIKRLWKKHQVKA